MSETPIEALTCARNLVAQKAVHWQSEIQRADSQQERRYFEGMAKAADFIEQALVRLIEEEKAVATARLHGAP